MWKNILVFLICFTASLDIKAGYPYFFEPIEPSFDQIAKILNQKDFDNERHTVSPHQIDQLDSIAQARNNPQLTARAIYWRVRMTQMNAQPPICIQKLEEALSLCSNHFDYDKACIEYQLAGNYERMGKYLKCYTHVNHSIEIFEKHKDHYFLGNAYLLLAQLSHDIGGIETAKSDLEKAKKNYQSAGYPLNRIYFFEALFAKDKKVSLAKNRLAISTGEKDWAMTLQAMLNNSEIFLNLNQLDSAESYCNRAVQQIDNNAPDNIMLRSLVNVTLAKLATRKGEYEKAKSYLTPMEKMADKLTGEKMLTDCYQLLWMICDRQGKQSEAYQYLKKYHEAYEEHEDELRKREVPKAQAAEAIARKNDKIKLLEQESAINRNYFYIAILIAVIVVLIALSLLMFLRHRYRIRDIENRELLKSLEQEAIIHRMNLKNFEDDIKQKDCEISSSTLLLANKNEVLQQIHDITKKYSDMGEIPSEYVRQMNEVIGNSLRNDDEWSRFKLHFTSVHPDFFVKLKEKAPDLTENDLRLCAYISIGMRAKQIAEMLSISPDSVNSNRYRLRKKLGLERGQSLDDFIRNI